MKPLVYLIDPSRSLFAHVVDLFFTRCVQMARSALYFASFPAEQSKIGMFLLKILPHVQFLRGIFPFYRVVARSWPLIVLAGCLLLTNGEPCSNPPPWLAVLQGNELFHTHNGHFLVHCITRTLLKDNYTYQTSISIVRYGNCTTFILSCFSCLQTVAAL